jgi:predicted PurR-regulated permease PerM
MDSIVKGSLVTLAVIAAVFFLHFGAPFFIPFFVALMISYALSPLVEVLTKFLRWRVISATLVVGTSLALIGSGFYAWSDDFAALWGRVPDATRTVADSVKKKMQQGQRSPVAEVQKAAAEIEAMAQTGKSKPAPAAPAAPVSTTSFWGMVAQVGKVAIVAGSQVLVVIFLVFFMLASGDLFKRKMVKMFGDTLSEKKITVQMIDEIDQQIRKYLVVLLVSNVLVGILTYVSFKMMGVNYPGLWAAVSAVLHTAPYFGPAIIAAASLVAAFVQFDDWSEAFKVSGVTILIATLVGSVFATWLSARQTQMNTTATFIGLLFFGWIWGLWGILLGIPLLAIVKAVCERKEEWKPVAEILSR